MSPVRNRLRVLVVVTLFVIAYGWSLGDLRRVLGFPLGSYGFYSNGSVVTLVDSEGAAADAGLQVGDRISFGGSSPLSRYAIVRGIAAYPGERLAGTVTHDGRSRRVVLVARPESGSEVAFVALRFILAFLAIGVATALLLTRPDVATWGFFLYCLSVISLPGAVFTFALPWSIRSYSVGIDIVLSNAAAVGGVMFALMFAHQPWTTWRRVTLGAIICGALVVIVFDGMALASGTSTDFLPPIQDVFTAFVLLAMLVGFVDSYRNDAGGSRQRLKWMIGALLVSVPALYAASWYYPGHLTYPQYVGLIAVQAVLPLSAAYAMFRTRVVDINFVISRTLVYGSLTALLVAIFSLLDATLARAFAESRVGLSIDITVALLLGFSLNAAHRRIDSVIDRVLFRERHRAEWQLERGATGVVHATDDTAITATLVQLPAEVLKLTGAAFYRSATDGFARITSVGQLAQLPERIDNNDALALSLRADLRPVRVDDVPLSHVSGSRSGGAAVLAIPIAMRGELAGFALYGAHSNGADIDPDEQRALLPLAMNAAVAYDHLETVALRARIAELESMLAPVSK